MLQILQKRKTLKLRERYFKFSIANFSAVVTPVAEGNLEIKLST
jgi:hypothetical protein